MSSAAMATVAVVDDDEPMCQALERSLRGHGYRVRTYTSARHYLDERDAIDAQCLVADINMPGMDGIGMRRAAREQGHDVPTVFISGHVDVSTAVRAMKEGAVDLLEKPVEEDELIRTVRRAIDRAVALRAAERELAAVWRQVALLTPREAQVCALVASGRRNKEIADLIGTTEKTVKVHRSRVMQKLGVDSVAELVRLVDRVLGGPSPAPTSYADTRRGDRPRAVTEMTAALATAAAARELSRGTPERVRHDAAISAQKYF